MLIRFFLKVETLLNNAFKHAQFIVPPLELMSKPTDQIRW